MARMTKLGSIDDQIKKKQEKLFELKEQSDAITEEIQALIEEREKLQRETLLEEFDKSGRTYEEVIEYFKSAPKRSISQPNGKRKYRSRKAKNSD